MSVSSEAWVGVLQDADGSEETEIATISYPGGLPVIELTNGQRFTAVEPAGTTVKRENRAAA